MCRIRSIRRRSLRFHMRRRSRIILRAACVLVSVVFFVVFIVV